MYTIIGGAGGKLDDERVKDWDMFEKVESVHHYVHLQWRHCELEWVAFNLDHAEIDRVTLQSKQC